MIFIPKNKDKNQGIMDCQICTEKFNKTTRSRVKCPYCQEEYCKDCFQTYLGGEGSIPKCMYCSKNFSLEFVSKVTTKTFYNKKYRDHRVKFYLETERSLLPATQSLVERVKSQKSKNKEIDILKQEEKELKKRLKIVQTQIKELRQNISDDVVAEIDEVEVSAEGEIDTKVKILCPCPKNDCRGFVKGSNKKCGICQVVVCGKCHKVKEKTHTCNKDDVESVNEVKKSTKPCPECKVRIQKSFGCSQMWCTECKTPFDWNTGKKISMKYFHNPHMVEWQMQNNRTNPNPPECVNGLPYIDRLHSHISKYITKDFTLNAIISCHTLINHILDIEMPRYPLGTDIRDNTDLRVKYLLDEISEKDWVFTLKKRQKKMEKDTEVHQILDMFTQASMDLINHMMHVHNKTDIIALVKNLRQLREYANKNLLEIHYRFDNQVPIIDAQWHMDKTKREVRGISSEA